jgi:DNA-3-methyladenine glycosylase II
MAPSTVTHTVTQPLPTPKLFDWPQTLRFLEQFEPMAMEQDIAGLTLTKGLRLCGRDVVFRVAPAAEGLSLTLFSAAPLPAATVQAAAERVRFFFSLDDDLAGFYALAEKDSKLAPRVASRRGMHHVKFPTPFENTAWAVLGQRAPLSVSRRMKERLVEAFGGTLVVDGRAHRCFPEAADLRSADEATLAKVIGHERKARYLRAVTAAFVGADESFLRQGPFDEVRDWLRAIDGVGEWSAGFVLFRGLGRGERLLMTEALFEAARRIYGATQSVSQLRALGGRYGHHMGYWALYLRAG